MTVKAKALKTLAVCLAVLVVGACSTPEESKLQVNLSSPATESPAPSAHAKTSGAPKGFEKYYKQSITWTSCGDNYDCATVTAPTDWSDKSSAPISLALQRLHATGERQGSLFINPGGPGASGTEFVTYAQYLFGDDVLSAYDIIGFDPRGTGRSTAIRCYDNAHWDQFISSSFPTTSAGLTQAVAAATSFGAACKAGTGDLLGHVDTVSAARDLDMLRAVVGETRLDYLGYSYGTQLGSTYAALFPGNVGRMVLDGAIDPNISAAGQTLGQAKGFESALHSYVENCQSGADCPLQGSVDEGMATVGKLLDGLLAVPMTTSDAARPLTQTLGVLGVIYPLYSEPLWPTLTSALASALNDNDGSGLLANADAYNSREADGTFTDNSGQAFIAISCLEPRQSSDPAVMAREAEALTSAAPTMGRFLSYGGVTCANWPEPVVKRDFDTSAPGAAPIVVVGTTGDPATPYVWAQGLASTLSSGVLVTYDGEGHGAYGSSNDCILNTVGDYLVKGVIPEADTQC